MKMKNKKTEKRILTKTIDILQKNDVLYDLDLLLEKKGLLKNEMEYFLPIIVKSTTMHLTIRMRFINKETTKVEFLFEEPSNLFAELWKVLGDVESESDFYEKLEKEIIEKKIKKTFDKQNGLYHTIRTVEKIKEGILKNDIQVSDDEILQKLKNVFDVTENESLELSMLWARLSFVDFANNEEICITVFKNGDFKKAKTITFEKK